MGNAVTAGIGAPGSSPLPQGPVPAYSPWLYNYQAAAALRCGSGATSHTALGQQQEDEEQLLQLRQQLQQHLLQHRQALLAPRTSLLSLPGLGQWVLPGSSSVSAGASGVTVKQDGSKEACCSASTAAAAAAGAAAAAAAATRLWGLQQQLPEEVASLADDFPHVKLLRLLGGSRIFQSVLAYAADEGLCLAKLLVRREPQRPLQHYLQLFSPPLLLYKAALTPDIHPNVCTYTRLVSSQRSLLMLRRFFATTIADRLHAQPFLTLVQQQFLAFQLLLAVTQLHSLGLVHGSIQCESVGVTSWLHACLVDPTPWRPVRFSLRDPRALAAFHQEPFTNKCYIAPERFLVEDAVETEDSSRRFDGSSESLLLGYPAAAGAAVSAFASLASPSSSTRCFTLSIEALQASDMFSTACALLEIFAAAAQPPQPVTLPLLLQLRTALLQQEQKQHQHKQQQDAASGRTRTEETRSGTSSSSSSTRGRGKSTSSSSRRRRRRSVRAAPPRCSSRRDHSSRLRATADGSRSASRERGRSMGDGLWTRRSSSDASVETSSPDDSSERRRRRSSSSSSDTRLSSGYYRSSGSSDDNSRGVPGRSPSDGFESCGCSSRSTRNGRRGYTSRGRLGACSDSAPQESDSSSDSLWRHGRVQRECSSKKARERSRKGRRRRKRKKKGEEQAFPISWERALDAVKRNRQVYKLLREELLQQPRDRRTAMASLERWIGVPKPDGSSDGGVFPPCFFSYFLPLYTVLLHPVYQQPDARLLLVRKCLPSIIAALLQRPLVAASRRRRAMHCCCCCGASPPRRRRRAAAAATAVATRPPPLPRAAEAAAGWQHLAAGDAAAGVETAAQRERAATPGRATAEDPREAAVLQLLTAAVDAQVPAVDRALAYQSILQGTLTAADCSGTAALLSAWSTASMRQSERTTAAAAAAVSPHCAATPRAVSDDSQKKGHQPAAGAATGAAARAAAHAAAAGATAGARAVRPAPTAAVHPPGVVAPCDPAAAAVAAGNVSAAALTAVAAAEATQGLGDIPHPHLSLRSARRFACGLLSLWRISRQLALGSSEKPALPHVLRQLEPRRRALYDALFASSDHEQQQQEQLSDSAAAAAAQFLVAGRAAADFGCSCSADSCTCCASCYSRYPSSALLAHALQVPSLLEAEATEEEQQRRPGQQQQPQREGQGTQEEGGPQGKDLRGFPVPQEKQQQQKQWVLQHQQLRRGSALLLLELIGSSVFYCSSPSTRVCGVRMLLFTATFASQHALLHCVIPLLLQAFDDALPAVRLVALQGLPQLLQQLELCLLLPAPSAACSSQSRTCCDSVGSSSSPNSRNSQSTERWRGGERSGGSSKRRWENSRKAFLSSCRESSGGLCCCSSGCDCCCCGCNVDPVAVAESDSRYSLQSLGSTAATAAALPGPPPAAARQRGVAACAFFSEFFCQALLPRLQRLCLMDSDPAVGTAAAEQLPLLLLRMQRCLRRCAVAAAADAGAGTAAAAAAHAAADADTPQSAAGASSQSSATTAAIAASSPAAASAGGWALGYGNAAASGAPASSAGVTATPLTAGSSVELFEREGENLVEHLRRAAKPLLLQLLMSRSFAGAGAAAPFSPSPAGPPLGTPQTRQQQQQQLPPAVAAQRVVALLQHAEGLALFLGAEEAQHFLLPFLITFLNDDPLVPSLRPAAMLALGRLGVLLQQQYLQQQQPLLLLQQQQRRQQQQQKRTPGSDRRQQQRDRRRRPQQQQQQQHERQLVDDVQDEVCCSDACCRYGTQFSAGYGAVGGRGSSGSWGGVGSICSMRSRGSSSTSNRIVQRCSMNVGGEWGGSTLLAAYVLPCCEEALRDLRPDVLLAALQTLQHLLRFAAAAPDNSVSLTRGHPYKGGLFSAAAAVAGTSRAVAVVGGGNRSNALQQNPPWETLLRTRVLPLLMLPHVAVRKNVLLVLRLLEQVWGPAALFALLRPALARFVRPLRRCSTQRYCSSSCSSAAAAGRRNVLAFFGTQQAADGQESAADAALPATGAAADTSGIAAGSNAEFSGEGGETVYVSLLGTEDLEQRLRAPLSRLVFVHLIRHPDAVELFSALETAVASATAAATSHAAAAAAAANAGVLDPLAAVLFTARCCDGSGGGLREDEEETAARVPLQAAAAASSGGETAESRWNSLGEARVAADVWKSAAWEEAADESPTWLRNCERNLRLASHVAARHAAAAGGATPRDATYWAPAVATLLAPLRSTGQRQRKRQQQQETRHQHRRPMRFEEEKGKAEMEEQQPRDGQQVPKQEIPKQQQREEQQVRSARGNVEQKRSQETLERLKQQEKEKTQKRVQGQAQKWQEIRRRQRNLREEAEQQLLEGHAYGCAGASRSSSTLSVLSSSLRLPRGSKGLTRHQQQCVGLLCGLAEDDRRALLLLLPYLRSSAVRYQQQRSSSSSRCPLSSLGGCQRNSLCAAAAAAKTLEALSHAGGEVLLLSTDSSEDSDTEDAAGAAIAAAAATTSACRFAAGAYAADGGAERAGGVAQERGAAEQHRLMDLSRGVLQPFPVMPRRFSALQPQQSEICCCTRRSRSRSLVRQQYLRQLLMSPRLPEQLQSLPSLRLSPLQAVVPVLPAVALHSSSSAGQAYVPLLLVLVLQHFLKETPQRGRRLVAGEQLSRCVTVLPRLFKPASRPVAAELRVSHSLRAAAAAARAASEAVVIGSAAAADQRLPLPSLPHALLGLSRPAVERLVVFSADPHRDSDPLDCPLLAVAAAAAASAVSSRLAASAAAPASPSDDRTYDPTFLLTGKAAGRVASPSDRAEFAGRRAAALGASPADDTPRGCAISTPRISFMAAAGAVVTASGSSSLPLPLQRDWRCVLLGLPRRPTLEVGRLYRSPEAAAAATAAGLAGGIGAAGLAFQGGGGVLSAAAGGGGGVAMGILPPSSSSNSSSSTLNLYAHLTVVPSASVSHYRQQRPCLPVEELQQQHLQSWVWQQQQQQHLVLQQPDGRQHPGTRTGLPLAYMRKDSKTTSISSSSRDAVFSSAADAAGLLVRQPPTKRRTRTHDRISCGTHIRPRASPAVAAAAASEVPEAAGVAGARPAAPRVPVYPAAKAIGTAAQSTADTGVSPSGGGGSSSPTSPSSPTSAVPPNRRSMTSGSSQNTGANGSSGCSYSSSGSSSSSSVWDSQISVTGSFHSSSSLRLAADGNGGEPAPQPPGESRSSGSVQGSTRQPFVPEELRRQSPGSGAALSSRRSSSTAAAQQQQQLRCSRGSRGEVAHYSRTAATSGQGDLAAAGRWTFPSRAAAPAAGRAAPVRGAAGVGGGGGGEAAGNQHVVAAASQRSAAGSCFAAAAHHHHNSSCGVVLCAVPGVADMRRWRPQGRLIGTMWPSDTGATHRLSSSSSDGMQKGVRAGSLKIASSEDGRLLVTANTWKRGGRITAWLCSTLLAQHGRPTFLTSWELPGGDVAATRMQFLHNTRSVAVGAADGRVHVYRIDAAVEGPLWSSGSVARSYAGTLGRSSCGFELLAAAAAAGENGAAQLLLSLQAACPFPSLQHLRQQRRLLFPSPVLPSSSVTGRPLIGQQQQQQFSHLLRAADSTTGGFSWRNASNAGRKFACSFPEAQAVVGLASFDSCFEQLLLGLLQDGSIKGWDLRCSSNISSATGTGARVSPSCSCCFSIATMSACCCSWGLPTAFCVSADGRWAVAGTAAGVLLLIDLRLLLPLRAYRVAVFAAANAQVAAVASKTAAPSDAAAARRAAAAATAAARAISPVLQLQACPLGALQVLQQQEAAGAGDMEEESDEEDLDTTGEEPCDEQVLLLLPSSDGEATSTDNAVRGEPAPAAPARSVDGESALQSQQDNTEERACASSSSGRGSREEADGETSDEASGRLAEEFFFAESSNETATLVAADVEAPPAGAADNLTSQTCSSRSGRPVHNSNSSGNVRRFIDTRSPRRRSRYRRRGVQSGYSGSFVLCVVGGELGAVLVVDAETGSVIAIFASSCTTAAAASSFSSRARRDQQSPESADEKTSGSEQDGVPAVGHTSLRRTSSRRSTNRSGAASQREVLQAALLPLPLRVRSSAATAAAVTSQAGCPLCAFGSARQFAKTAAAVEEALAAVATSAHSPRCAWLPPLLRAPPSYFLAAGNDRCVRYWDLEAASAAACALPRQQHFLRENSSETLRSSISNRRQQGQPQAALDAYVVLGPEGSCCGGGQCGSYLGAAARAATAALGNVQQAASADAAAAGGSSSSKGMFSRAPFTASLFSHLSAGTAASQGQKTAQHHQPDVAQFVGSLGCSSNTAPGLLYYQREAICAWEAAQDVATNDVVLLPSTRQLLVCSEKCRLHRQLNSTSIYYLLKEDATGRAANARKSRVRRQYASVSPASSSSSQVSLAAGDWCFCNSRGCRRKENCRCGRARGQGLRASQDTTAWRERRRQRRGLRQQHSTKSSSGSSPGGLRQRRHISDRARAIAIRDAWASEDWSELFDSGVSWESSSSRTSSGSRTSCSSRERRRRGSCTSSSSRIDSSSDEDMRRRGPGRIGPLQHGRQHEGIPSACVAGAAPGTPVVVGRCCCCGPELGGGGGGDTASMSASVLLRQQALAGAEAGSMQVCSQVHEAAAPRSDRGLREPSDEHVDAIVDLGVVECDEHLLLLTVGREGVIKIWR